jgi:Bacterial regulatory helix-turn-helix protein, lysR family
MEAARQAAFASYGAPSLSRLRDPACSRDEALRVVGSPALPLLRHLRYFLAVGEAWNFTKAAAQLRSAQPALSQQVKHLEDEIGARQRTIRNTQRISTIQGYPLY